MGREAADSIVIDELRKSFGATSALGGISLRVPAGTVYGLLGPNGAGKTTTIRILATLTRPDSGSAVVAGHDVVRGAASVRGLIGLTGQYAALDEALTGRENLMLIGQLHRLSRRDAARRGGELLELVGVADAADRPVRTYSGGMRRRVDLAASLVARPAVLFLDEPTTGLDPRSRVEIWTLIGQLLDEGTTVLLTTQYLEEVDRLASRIAVIDRGRVIAEGTIGELKRSAGNDVLELRAANGFAQAVAAALAPMASGPPRISGQIVAVPVSGRSSSVVEAARRLDAVGLAVEEISLRRPSLDDVFLQLTGQPVESASEGVA